MSNKNLSSNIGDGVAGGADLVSAPADWAVSHAPAAATQATCTKAAGGAGVRHICTSLAVTVAAAGTAQTPITVSLRDGATGAGTVLWSQQVQLPINGVWSVSLDSLNIVGSAATAMTLETSAAPAAAVIAAVAMTGHDAA